MVCDGSSSELNVGYLYHLLRTEGRVSVFRKEGAVEWVATCRGSERLIFKFGGLGEESPELF